MNDGRDSLRHIFKSIVAAFVLSVGFAVPVVAGLYEEALNAHNRGDYSTALRLFRPLAEQGDTNAEFFLGAMYQFGRGVPRDDAKAVKWFRKAAAQGDTGAQNHLGFMYKRGRGVPQDYAEAARWYRKAAEQGHIASQYFLGLSYSLGRGVPQDYVLAHMWMDLAASQGHHLAAKACDDIARKMTPAQITEAQRLAREWKPK